MATWTRNYDFMKVYLRDPYADPNPIDLKGYTPLMHAAANQDVEAMRLLLNNPGVDSMIKNLDNKAAHDLIFDKKTFDQKTNTLIIDHRIDPALMDKQSLELKRMLFARMTLDTIAKQESKPIKSIYERGTLEPAIMDDVIKIIKSKIDAIEKKQIEADDTMLPSSALLPTYATDDFIMDMIYFRIHQ